MNSYQNSSIKSFLFQYFSFLNNQDKRILLFLMEINEKLEYKLLKVNDTFLRFFGIDKQEVQEKKIEDVLPPAKLDIILRMINYSKKQLKPSIMKTKECNTIIIPFEDEQMKSTFLLGMITQQDSTSQKPADDKMMDNIRTEKNEIIADIYDNMIYAMSITDANSRILFVNKAFTKLTGYAEQDVIGKNPSILSSGRHSKEFYDNMWKQIQEKGYWRGEIWNKKKNGELFLEEITISQLKDKNGNVKHYTAIFRDITEKKRMENQIRFLALFDELTELPNRQYFNRMLDQCLKEVKNKKMAILFLDLDRFKEINDTLGHSAGDKIIRYAAARLKQCVGNNGFLTRYGGDEFVICLYDIEQREDCIPLIQNIKDRFLTPFRIDEYELFLTVSIGVSIYPDDALDSETLIKHADTAMYAAKKQGRNNYTFYDKTLDEESLEKLILASDLRKALKHNEFFLNFQPQFSIQTGELTGLESLIRWNHPTKGLLFPKKFIAIAEEIGFIPYIDQWVLYEACKLNKAWQQSGYKPTKVSVNLSMMQFQQTNLVDMVVKTLQETKLDPHLLDIELTESIVMVDPELSLFNIQKLKEIGVQFSIDDFGVDYSSLRYLKQLSFDRLKIDRSFIKDLLTNKDDQIIVKAIIQLAHNLGLKVIAEGVENEEQFTYLQKNNCDEIQGYFLSRPISAEKIVKYIS